jgi:arsenite-transporting ATPase
VENKKRFYIFTGKGGVGKTTLALSFCKFLEANNHKYLYAYIKNSKISDTSKSLNESLHIAKELGINTLGLDLLDCSKGYISKKLKSKTIASWIIKTPFFQSLINMIPGFSYVIYLGQLLEMLVDDPDLTIVLDSPSSGHALTMLESTKNFNEIFQDGTVYDDTNKMLKVLQSDNFTKINIVTLPTLLAIHEGEELKESLKKIHSFSTDIYSNNCLNDYLHNDLPDFLKAKINNENQAISENQEHIKNQISYSMAHSNKEVIKDLVPSMQSLV